MTTIEIARVCHEANRAYCQTLGDESQLSWDDAPFWQVWSSALGVEALAEDPDITFEEQHARWMQEKLSAGWVWGPDKNTERRTHPCLVPYDELPEEQRVKDRLFQAVARALLRT